MKIKYGITKYDKTVLMKVEYTGNPRDEKPGTGRPAGT
jgi:hypothetical protein